MTEQRSIRDEKLRTLKDLAEAAQAAYLQGEKALFTADGSRVYSDEVHRQELGKLDGERRRALDGIVRQVQEVRQAAEAEIERIENADPADALTSTELETANQKRAFALEAAETLDAEAFGKRLEAVLAGGDRGSIFAYLMAGRRKRKEGNGHTALDEALGKMEGILGGERRAAQIEAAKRKAGEAGEVELLAGNLKVGARSAAEAWKLRQRRTS